jgi:hypothetical protein
MTRSRVRRKPSCCSVIELFVVLRAEFTRSMQIKDFHKGGDILDVFVYLHVPHPVSIGRVTFC